MAPPYANAPVRRSVTEALHNPRRQFAIDVLRSLRDAGFEAYWAGGCVRDHLLGLAPKDFDVATNATPDEVRRLFGRRRTLAVGAAFGVIVVLGPREAGQIEVTTFRHDGRYSDGRHPDSVTFGTAEEDVRRRDFTINGMLYDPIAERVLDCVGGQEDLRAGVIRAIGDSRQRFDEDKLRMLRAVRFAARLGFRLDDATREAIGVMAGQITVVAAERIAQEMRAILIHPSRAEGIDLCRQVGLLAVILPEIDGVSHSTLDVGCSMLDVRHKTLNVQRPTSNVQHQTTDAARVRSPGAPEACSPKSEALTHVLDVLRRLLEPSFPLALATLLHQLAPTPGEAAEAAETVCRRLRLSNNETECVVWLVRHQQDLREARAMPWPRLQRLLVREGIGDLLDFHAADLAAAGRDADPLTFCRQQLERSREDLDPPPLITGNDLIRHGVPRGKIYQPLLDRVRDAQLRVPNRQPRRRAGPGRSAVGGRRRCRVATRLARLNPASTARCIACRLAKICRSPRGSAGKWGAQDDGGMWATPLSHGRGPGMESRHCRVLVIALAFVVNWAAPASAAEEVESAASVAGRLSELEAELAALRQQIHGDPTAPSGPSGGCCCQAACGQPCCCEPCCCLPCCQMGWYGGAELVWAQPVLHFSDLEYDYEATPRIWLGYNGCGLGVRGHWWWFDGDADPRAELLILTPSIVATITSQESLELDLADLEVTKLFSACGSTIVVAAGARDVRYERREQLLQTIVNNNVLITAVSVTEREQIEAIGPTVAAEVVTPVTANWSVYTGFRATIGFGDQETSDFVQNLLTGAVLAIDEEEQNDRIQVIELDLGLQYAVGRWFARAGWQAQHWDEPTSFSLGVQGFAAALGVNY